MCFRGEWLEQQQLREYHIKQFGCVQVYTFQAEVSFFIQLMYIFWETENSYGVKTGAVEKLVQ